LIEQTRQRVGLLVIHGIGDQKRGETLKGVVEGLEVAYGKGRFRREDTVATGTFRRVGPDGSAEAAEVRVYEAYWADQLPHDKVRGSFHLDRVQQLVWFPFLNWRTVENFASEYRRTHVLGWTAILVPIAAIVTAAYVCLEAIFALVQGLIDAARTSSARRASADETHQLQSWRSAFQRARERRLEGPLRTPLDAFLDNDVADVFNYVDSAGDAHPIVREAARSIYEVFRSTLERAVVDDQCTEIQILAHSLGSVIAFHGLTTYREETEALVSLAHGGEKRPPLTHVFTIGSPLEKFRFFWPKLIAGRHTSSAAQFEWHNFTSPGDLIAGPLRTYDWVPRISNHRIAGAWGLLTAHTGYRRQPTFLRIFGPALTGEPVRKFRITQHLGRTAFAFLCETIGIPIAIAALAVIGGLFIYASFAMLASAVAFPIDVVQSSLGLHWTLHRTLAAWASRVLGWLGLTVSIPVALWLGFRNGKGIHQEYWTTGFTLDRRRTVEPKTVYRDPRTYGIFVAQIALLVLIAIVGLRTKPGGAFSRSQAWLIIMVIMAAFAVLAGRGITGYWRGILIDNRNKISLGRLQLLTWSLVVLSAIVTAGVTNGAFGAQSALAIHVPEELWVLLGISTASAIAGPALLAPKRDQKADLTELNKTVNELERVDQVRVNVKDENVLLSNESKADARWGDLLKGDESGNAASVDVGKLQMFFFTFVLVLGYAVALAKQFNAAGAITALPIVDSSMNTLLGISHTGYLANKVVPHSREAPKGQSAQTPAPPAGKSSAVEVQS
jgi:hypothetical protein